MLIDPALNNDVDLYQKELAKLETEVIKPIFEAWKEKKIEVIIDSCNGEVIKPVRTPAWKFWLRTPTNLLGLVK